MPDYSIFGAVLRSQLEFPELVPTTTDVPRWSLTISTHAPPYGDAVTMGSEDVEPGIRVSLSRHAHGLRLVYDDTGSFDISADGTHIDWAQPADPDLTSVRKDVLGRVLAICLHQQGVVALHGSAVQVSDVAIAFLAPKFHGKSTTAATLVESGAKLLADDIVAVSTGNRPVVLPSVPFVQLWKDSAARVATGSVSVQGNETGRKLQRRWGGSQQNADAAAPLDAVYLLAPVLPDAATGIRRIRLSGVEGALALLGQAKVANLLGVERRADLLQATSELADRIPVYRLEVPRDFERLPELTAALWQWHAPHAARPAIGGP